MTTATTTTKKTSTSYSPRIYPRPEYPSGRSILWNVLDRSVRIPLMTCALLFWILYPLYTKALTVYQQAGYDHEGLFFFMAMLATRITVYTLVHGLFFVLEWQQYLEDARLNRKPIQIPKMSLIVKTLRLQLISSLFVQPLALVFVLLPIMKLFGGVRYDAPLYGMTKESTTTRTNPPLETVVYYYGLYLFSHALNEILFYVFHRILHHSWFYARFHKQHHEYTGPFSPSAEYAHPLEILLANLVPALAGPVLTGAHPAVMCAFVAHKLKRSYEHHSGYALAGTVWEQLWLVDAETSAFHDFHHTANQGNFGSFDLDWLFGTMDHYMAAGGYRGYIQKQEGQRASYLHPPPKQAAAATVVPVQSQ